jgi:VWFA-related protein
MEKMEKMEAIGPMTTRLLNLTLLVILSSVWLPGMLSGVAEAQDDTVLRVETQLVLVDVVASGDALALAALSGNDFRIFDEGQEQELSIFERVAGRTDLRDALSLPAGVATNRRDWRGATPLSATVILVDRVNTPTDAQVFTNQQLIEFLESFDRTEGLALYELRSDGLRILHDFTDDPGGLAVAAAAMEPEHSLALESSASVGGFESDLPNVGLDPRIGENLGGGTGFDRRSADYFLNDRVQKTSVALDTVTRHLEGLSGRRNIVWLSGRFPFSFDIWSRSDLANEIEVRTMSQVESISFALSEANIAIYPVDVRGPGPDGGAEVFGVADAIAKASGGRVFRTNAVGEAIEAAVGDAAMSFTLGFYPSEVDDDRDRRSLRVEVPNEDLDLLYRPSYVGFGGPDEVTERVGLAELLSSPLDATRIGLTGVVGPAGDGSQFELVTLVNVDDLTLIEADGRLQGSINVGLVFRAGDDGTAYIIPQATFPIDLTPEQYESFRETGLVVQRFLNTEGRTGTVRVVIQDQTSGAAGSMWVPVGTN